ncbi:hypothetical protein GCM10009642_33830 [Nocardiopsis metallicus]
MVETVPTRRESVLGRAGSSWAKRPTGFGAASDSGGTGARIVALALGGPRSGAGSGVLLSEDAVFSAGAVFSGAAVPSEGARPSENPVPPEGLEPSEGCGRVGREGGGTGHRGVAGELSGVGSGPGGPGAGLVDGPRAGASRGWRPGGQGPGEVLGAGEGSESCRSAGAGRGVAAESPEQGSGSARTGPHSRRAQARAGWTVTPPPRWGRGRVRPLRER